jgi:ribosomal protein L4
VCIDPRFIGSSAVEKIVLLLNKFYFIISLFWQIWARLGRVVVVRLDKAWQARFVWVVRGKVSTGMAWQARQGTARFGKVGSGKAWQAWFFQRRNG